MLLNFNLININSEDMEESKKSSENVKKEEFYNESFHQNKIMLMAAGGLLIFGAGAIIWYWKDSKKNPQAPPVLPTNPLQPPQKPFNSYISKPLITLTQQELNDLKEGEGTRGSIMDMSPDEIINLNENERKNLLEIKDVFLGQFLNKSPDGFGNRSSISLKDFLSIDNNLFKILSHISLSCFLRQLSHSNLKSRLTIDILKKTLFDINEYVNTIITNNETASLYRKRQIAEALFYLCTSLLQRGGEIDSPIAYLFSGACDSREKIEKINQVFEINIAAKKPSINIENFSNFTQFNIVILSAHTINILCEKSIYNLYMMDNQKLNALSDSELRLLDFNYINECKKDSMAPRLSSLKKSSSDISNPITEEHTVKLHLYLSHKILKKTMKFFFKEIYCSSESSHEKQKLLDNFEVFFNKVHVRRIETYNGRTKMIIAFGIEGEQNNCLFNNEQMDFIIRTICNANDGITSSTYMKKDNFDFEFALNMSREFLQEAENHVRDLCLQRCIVDNSGAGMNNCLLLSYANSLLEAWSRISVGVSNIINNNEKAKEVKRALLTSYARKIQYFNCYIKELNNILVAKSGSDEILLFKEHLRMAVEGGDMEGEPAVKDVMEALPNIFQPTYKNIKDERVINNENDLFEIIFDIYNNLSNFFRFSERIKGDNSLPSSLLQAFICVYNDKQKNNFPLHMLLISLDSLAIVGASNEGINSHLYANRSYTNFLKKISPIGGKCSVIREENHFKSLSLCVGEREECQQEIEDTSKYMLYFSLKFASKKPAAGYVRNGGEVTYNFALPYAPQLVVGKQTFYQTVDLHWKKQGGKPKLINHNYYFFTYDRTDMPIIDAGIFASLYKNNLSTSPVVGKIWNTVKKRLAALMINFQDLNTWN